MKARFSVSVYQRAADVIVVPQNGGDGLYFDVGPIERVEPSRDEVAQAIERAIAVSDLSLGVVNLSDYKSPVLKALGLRSNKEFEQAVRGLCTVSRSGGDIEVTLFCRARDGRGFEETDRVLQLPATLASTEIADATLQLLQQSNA
jgi:hypothetical protein